MGFDIHSRKMAAGIHILKSQKEAAARVLDQQPDADTLREMLGLVAA